MEVNGRPCIKLSEDLSKVTFPGKKDAYRLYDSNGLAILDLLVKHNESNIPKVGEPYLCQHPFIPTKRSKVTSSRIESLYKVYWKDGRIVEDNTDTLNMIRDRVAYQLQHLRPDHIRPLNPTPYKVTTASSNFYSNISSLSLIINLSF